MAEKIRKKKKESRNKGIEQMCFRNFVFAGVFCL